MKLNVQKRNQRTKHLCESNSDVDVCFTQAHAPASHVM